MTQNRGPTGSRASSELERGVVRENRRAAGVDGFDDLSVVDALEVDRG
jgi:hypothetical protein